MENNVGPDETACYEPSHLDLHCLQRYLCWSAGMNELNLNIKNFVMVVWAIWAFWVHLLFMQIYNIVVWLWPWGMLFEKVILKTAAIQKTLSGVDTLSGKVIIKTAFPLFWKGGLLSKGKNYFLGSKFFFFLSRPLFRRDFICRKANRNLQNCLLCKKWQKIYQGPVVQSIVSLTTSLRVISLTVSADPIYSILIFFAEKMWVAFALQKLLTFFQQKISEYLRITRCKF